MHVLEWISNLLSFFSLVFADVFLGSTRTVRVILGIFIQAWTTRASCRFRPSECIVTATNLKDFRMSLILENKILKKETLKTTRKSCLYFIPRELFSSVTTSALTPQTISCALSSAAIGDPSAFTSTWPSSHRFPSEIWKSFSHSLTSMTSTTDDKICLSRTPCLFMPISGIGWNKTPDNNNNRCA